MIVGTHEEAAATRFARSMNDGRRVWRSQYFGPAPSPAASSTLSSVSDEVVYVDPQPGETRPAQAFLIEQEGGAVVAPHFHYVDQFQVVVAGGGSLGRHKVMPLAVHFAGASTGYGPISAGDQGLSYFTFRATADETGAQYLPQARSRMRAVTRRNVVAPHIELSADAALQARRQTDAECVLEDADGLGVFVLRIAPGQTCRLPDAAAGNGVTWLLAGGGLQHDGRTLRPWACAYVGADDAAAGGRKAEGAGDGLASACASLTATASGAEVLVMRYPMA